MSQDSIATRRYRERMLADPYRPGYHFAIPDGNGIPGDCNGAFFADGRYHLMYLYETEATNAFHWGHQSSTDLIHWRNHPDALILEDGDRGCFSGGAFVDDDGTAYLTFWKFASKDFKTDNGGIVIAFAPPPYEHWERIRPLAIEGSRDVWGTMDIEHDGFVDHISCADPSNIWKKDGFYYMQTGNLCVLNAYGRAPDSDPRYKGDWTDLFRSKDLHKWEFVHRFYTNPQPGADNWPDASEDDMCPNFLPLPDRRVGGNLTETWLQAFIAHNKGGQYYTGRLEGEKFIPEQHGRFSWKDNTCFAPECLIDDKNRQIGWFWLQDNPKDDYARFDWTGVFSLPREFWYDGGLHMTAASELERLQYNRQLFDIGHVSGGAPLGVKNGDSFRLKVSINPLQATCAGFIVRADAEKDECVGIYVDLSAGELVMDTTSCAAEGRPLRESAPFTLKEGERIDLDIFVDKSVIEVFVNNRQAISRRAFPSDPTSATGVSAISDGADFGVVNVWEMSPSNPY